MKKLSIILGLCFLVSFIFAQEKSPEQKAEKATAKMAKQLDLTADQQNSVKALYITRYRKRAELKNNKTEAKSGKAEKTIKKYVEAEFEQNLDKVLTEEQKEKRAILKAQKKKKVKYKASKSKASKKKNTLAMAKMTPEQIHQRATIATDQLDTQVGGLSSDQKEQSISIHKDYYQKSSEINERSNEVDRMTLKANRMTLHKTFRANIDNLLTEEQKAKRNNTKQMKMEKKQAKKALKKGSQ